MLQELPEWRKAWKVEDPLWVKQRQFEWKKIKNSFAITSSYSTKEQKMIKAFFMTGSCYDIYELADNPSTTWNIDIKPLCVRACALFECWFSPDLNAENIDRIRGNTKPRTWSDSVSHFHYALKNYKPDTDGSVFNGLDDELYEIFSLPRCRPKDYPHLDLKRFNRIAENRFYNLTTLIQKYFGESYYSQSIAPIAFNSWIDTIVPTYTSVDMGNRRFIDIRLSDVIKAVNIVREKPENYHNAQLELADKLIIELKAMSFPRTMIKVSKSLKLAKD